MKNMNFLILFSSKESAVGKIVKTPAVIGFLDCDDVLFYPESVGPEATISFGPTEEELIEDLVSVLLGYDGGVETTKTEEELINELLG